MRPYLKKVEKDRVYLNKEVIEPGHKIGPISTSHVPIDTPRVSNGPLGCQAHV